MRDFVGRPTPLYLASRLSEKVGGPVYLKREDLNHTGAHKINNAVGQALLAQRDGQAPDHAEPAPGSRRRGATACALFGLECLVYMGRRTCGGRRPTSSGCGCSAPK